MWSDEPRISMFYPMNESARISNNRRLQYDWTVIINIWFHDTAAVVKKYYLHWCDVCFDCLYLHHQWFSQREPLHLNLCAITVLPTGTSRHVLSVHGQRPQSSVIAIVVKCHMSLFEPIKIMTSWTFHRSLYKTFSAVSPNRPHAFNTTFRSICSYNSNR